MKKILISILIVLLLVLSYFLIWHGITIIKVESIKGIKSASSKLEEDLTDANELEKQIYPSKEEELKKAVNNLKSRKQEYESKSKYSTGETNTGTVEIKTYKNHYLWTVLGNYKKEESLKSINLDLKTTRNTRCL